LRCANITFETFKKRFLDLNNADILLCIPTDTKEDYKNNEYYRNAKYIKTVDGLKDINIFYDEIVQELKGSPKWRDLLEIKEYWLGGIKDLRFKTLYKALKKIFFSDRKDKTVNSMKIFADYIFRQKGPYDQLSGGGYVLLYRHLVLKMILEKGLDKKYDRFIITRSDHFYGAPDTDINTLDSDFVWIPEGEDWRGYCDRHWILSSKHLVPCLDLLKPIFCESKKLYDLMKDRFNWNSESYIKFVWDLRNIQVKRFPRVQFLVRSEGGTKTWTEGVYNPDLNLRIAYQSEFEEFLRTKK
jgi:hypothetical protein